MEAAPEQVAEQSLSSPRQWARALYALERELPGIIVVVAFAGVLAGALSSTLNQDGWLALLSGREIVQHGLPSVDHLTVWSAGRRWTDQQWLGQLGLYGLYALGGLRAVLVAHWLVVSSTFALLVVAARRLGGSPISTALVAALAFIPLLGTISEVRTEALAGLLLLVVMWLLIEELRRPTRRVYLVLPLLVLWANVHGSVLLGVALCVLAGASFVLGSRSSGEHAAVLIVGSIAAVFASPYALSLVGYYHRTLLNRDFSKFVTEWKPTTLSLEHLPVFLLAGGGLWLLARSGRSTLMFERVAFVLTALAAFEAVRNVGWLAIVSVLVLPHTFGHERTPRVAGRIAPLALGLLAASAAVVVVALVTAAGAPGKRLAERYPAQVSDVVARTLARDPRARVFANESYADWLVWRVPAARGRVTFDARFELLTSAELRQLYDWASQSTDHWRAAAAGASIAVLPRDPAVRAALLRSGARVAFSNSETAVFVLPPGFGR